MVATILPFRNLPALASIASLSAACSNILSCLTIPDWTMFPILNLAVNSVLIAVLSNSSPSNLAASLAACIPMYIPPICKIAAEAAMYVITPLVPDSFLRSILLQFYLYLLIQ